MSHERILTAYSSSLTKTSKDSYPVICYILMFYISYLHQLSMESNGISIIISLISILASILLAIQKTALSWSSLNIQTSLSLNKSPTDTGLVYKRFPKLFKIKEKITNEASFNKIKFFGFTLFIFYSYIFKNRISITSSTEFSFPIQCYSNFQ